MKMDKELIKELLMYGAGGLIFISLAFGNPFNSDSNDTATPSDGDTRIERDSEHGYDEPGYYTEWEETYYNGKWIPTEEYDRIKEEEYNKECDSALAYLDYTDVYFLNNGYYYHMDRNCDGLEGYDDLNQMAMIELQDYPNLKPCNWCSDN